jgi:hypothetical protein
MDFITITEGSPGENTRNSLVESGDCLPDPLSASLGCMVAPGATRRAPRWAFAAGFALASSGAHTAFAQPVRLNYVGDSTCSNQSQLEHEVIIRNPAVRWTTESRPALEADVRVTTTPTGTTGVLVMRPPDGEKVTRKIRGRDCDEVLEAIGLIIALSSIERDQEPPARKETPAAPPAAPIVPSTPPEIRRWAFGGGVQAVALVGVAPSPLPGVGAFFDVARSGDGFAPAFRLGVQEAIRTGLREPEGTASFRLVAGVAELCPVALGVSDSWTLRPCAHASYGSLRASGSVSGNVTTESHPWATAGLALRLEWAWSRIASIELAGGSSAALVDSQFWLEGRAFHETAPVTGWLGLGLVVRLD